MKEKVKIKTAIIGILLFSGINLSAQRFEVGIAAGFDMANLHLTNSPENNFIHTISPIATFNINGFLSFKNKTFWGLSVEPGFIRKGWSQSFNSNDPKNKLRLYYLQMPVLSDFYLTDRLYLSVGPEISYLINAKNKYDSNTQDIAEYLHRFELSGMAAIGFRMSETMSISFRYSHGLTEISEDIMWTYPETGSANEAKDYNQYFQVLIKMRIKNWR